LDELLAAAMLLLADAGLEDALFAAVFVLLLALELLLLAPPVRLIGQYKWNSIKRRRRRTRTRRRKIIE
jgi:hypothetical protein